VEEKYPLGDLKKMSLRDVWFGDAYAAMRRRFRENWESIHACGNCSYAYRGGDCSRDTIVQSVFFQP
jgi:MoaA/NifB/PqqE/SkfB family radical SAM enzyme